MNRDIRRFQLKDQARLKALAEYSIIDTPAEPELYDLVQLATQVCNTPVAFLSFIDGEREWFKSVGGAEWKDIPLELSLSRFIPSDKDIFALDDLTLQDGFNGKESSALGLDVKFFAGAVLLSREGYPIGTLGVLDRCARTLTSEQLVGLEVLGRQVMKELELRRRALHAHPTDTGLNVVVSPVTEDLVLTEERLRLGLQAGDSGIWDWDIVNNKVQWSEQIYQFHGVRCGEFGGTLEDFAKLVHPDDKERVFQAIQEAIKNGTRYREEFRAVDAETGDTRWLSTSGIVHYDSDGRPLRMLGATTDVTMRRRGERLLAEQKRVLEIIAASTPLAEVLDAIARLVEEQSSGCLCSVLILNSGTRTLHVGAAPSMPDTYRARIDGVKISDDASGFGAAAHRGCRIVTADIEHDPLWGDFRLVALQHGLRACWSEPIYGRDGRVLGTVATYSLVPGEPRELDLQVLSAAAHLAGIALERDQAAADAQTLLDLSLTVSGETDVRTIVQAITDAGTKLSRAQFGAFFYNVKDEDGEAYTLYTISGVSSEHFSKFPMPRATHLFGPTFRGEGIIRLADVTRDPRYGLNPPYHGMPEGHLPVRSYLSIPVRSRSGEILGGLFFGHEVPGVFTPECESVISNLAAQAGIVLDNADLLRRSRESEEKFRLMANAIPQLAWMARPDGHIFWYNEQWYRYTGTTLRDMEGWGWQRVHDPAVLPRVLEGWRIAIDSGVPFEMEFPLRSASGEFRSFLTQVNPLFGEDGTIQYWFGTNTDVTEWRRQQEALAVSEARLRAVVQATPECVKIVMPDGSLDYMNPAGICMIESDDGLDNVRGSSVPEIIAREYREKWEENHRRVCAGERLSWEFEIIGFRGTRRWMETHAVPLTLPDGSTAQLAVTRDVSERKAAEQQREALLESERAARSEAERVSRMKDEFLATLSHELRTPLQSILGFSQLLKRKKAEDPTVSYGLSAIARNARAQAQLIEDLLDMSRITTGKLLLNLETTSIANVVDAAIDIVAPMAHAKDIIIRKSVDPTATSLILGDRARLQQVIWNLLTNAVKFTPSGGSIDVRLKQSSFCVEIEVSDTGQGIDPAFLPFMFERFRQADSSTTRKYGGLGLGLSLVKQLVELHGGTVRAESKGIGKGATFTLSLPVARACEVPRVGDELNFSAVINDYPTTELDLSDVTILIVDDERDIREIACRILEDAGATVVTAETVAEALELFQLVRPDVLLSDIGMPGEDGYELIRRIRSLPAEQGGRVPAAALTAYARSEDRRKALLAGYQSHVVKPVEPAELVTVVASIAGRTGQVR